MGQRTQNQIDSIILLAKQNCFDKSMIYINNLYYGVSPFPILKRQETLIMAAESPYATLEQKNLFCDWLVGNNFTITDSGSLTMLNLLAKNV